MLREMLARLSPETAKEMAAVIQRIGEAVIQFGNVVRTLAPELPEALSADVGMADGVHRLVTAGKLLPVESVLRFFPSAKAAAEWFAALCFPLGMSVDGKCYVHVVTRLPGGRSIRSMIQPRRRKGGRPEHLIAVPLFVELIRHVAAGATAAEALLKVGTAGGRTLPRERTFILIVRELRRDVASLTVTQEAACV